MKKQHKQKKWLKILGIWVNFIVIFIIFYVVGGMTFNWWNLGYLSWIVLAFTLFGAISGTIRVLTSGSKSGYRQQPMQNYSSDQSPISIHEGYDDDSSYTFNSDREHERYCPECGSPLEPNDAFCRNCGQKIYDY